MARRGLTSLCCFAAAVGFVLITLGSSQRTRFVSPGALASQHSSVVHECEDCHRGGNEALGGWIHAGLDSESPNQQSHLCLKCHADLGPHALQPHSHDPGSLAALTQHNPVAKSADSLVLTAAKQGLGGPGRGDGSVACATCHREHHGSDSDLTALSDRQCQVCHATAFHSLADGHPDFSLVPYQRRQHLYFDHESHFGNHFPRREPERMCRDCHLVDNAGQAMLLGGFDQTCAECHAEQVVTDETPGLLLAAVPGLDYQTIQEKGFHVGEWPESYPRHVQASSRIGPVMELLLQSYEVFDELEGQLREIDLSELSTANDEQIQAAHQWAWAYKTALMDVVEGGQTELRRRLSQVLAARVPQRDIDQIVNRVPVELVRMMQQRWLPNLATELHDRGTALEQSTTNSGARDETISSPSVLAAVIERQKHEARISNGWYLRDSDLSLRYRPPGHADDLLQLWLNVTARFQTVQPSSSGTPSAADTSMRTAFLEFSSPFASGRCTKCHTADATPTDGLRMNWTASSRYESFTRFVHAPHIRLLNDACESCHTLTAGSNATDWHLYQPDFIHTNGSLATDPSQFHSDFAGISKATCARCHTSQDAGDRCLVCHNYHVPHGR